MEPPYYSTAVREMPEDERPRERLARLGPEALRDAELLAILFRTGTKKQGAVALGEQALRQFGDLRSLSRASVEELKSVPGLGTVKAIELKAALELGRRLATYSVRDRVKMTTAEDIARLLMVDFKNLEGEHFKSVLLNIKNEVLKVVEVSRGSLNETLCHPRDVLRQAVRENAAKIVICHNHPSGNPEPSTADIEATERIVEAGKIVGIAVVDHIIFGDGCWVSMKSRDMM
mgnify:CR=1 FL=1